MAPRALLLHVPTSSSHQPLPTVYTNVPDLPLITALTPGPMPQTSALGLCYALILTGFRLPLDAFRSPSPLTIIDHLISLQGVRVKEALLFSLPSYSQARHMGFRYRFMGWALTVPNPVLFCLLSASIQRMDHPLPSTPRFQPSVAWIFPLGSRGQDTCLSLRGITSGKDKSTTWLSLSGCVESCSLLQGEPCSPPSKSPKTF